MDRTRSTLLMRVRDPADGRAWGEFVRLYEPLLTAYVRRKGLARKTPAMSFRMSLPV
jgi:hypothetical protein